jgi:hypothetical protein
MYRVTLRRTEEAAQNLKDRTPQELQTLVDNDTYDGFRLTGAIRLGWGICTTPKEGYRHEVYHDPDDGECRPVLMVAVSAEKMMDVFMESVQALAHRRRRLDVCLISAHGASTRYHYRRDVDIIVLLSTLEGYEDLLLNDGFFGIAVIDRHSYRELQLSEEKLLLVYGSFHQALRPFEEVLARHHICHDQNMAFITDAEHVHISDRTMRCQYRRLRQTLF